MKATRIGPLLVENPTEDIINKYNLEAEDFFTGELTFIKLYVNYDSNQILIPRYSDVGIKNIPEKLNKGVSINVKCKAKPRDNIQKQATDFIIKNNNCLINLAPRRGKTVISIMAMCKIKKKTLILVDQTNILKQWKQRILEFTNLTSDDIGIFQSDKQEIDKPVVIGMVQSIKNHVERDVKTIREKFKDFGLVIVDEVHAIVGTEKLSLPLYSISSERIVGLTATTYRSDNREYLFTEWFSDKIFSDTKYDILPKIYMIGIDSYLSRKDEKYIMTNYFKQQDSSSNQQDNSSNQFGVKEYFNKLKWVKKIQKNKLYMNKITDLISHLYFDKKRTLLIISEYVDFLQILCSYMLKRKIDINDIELYTDSIGATKSVKKLLSPSRNNNKKITLTTYKMCNKAVDRPDWDCLVMLTPVSVSSPSFEQTVGRVCTLCDGKEDALVYDIYDKSINRLRHMAKARYKFYQNLGCTITSEFSEEQKRSETGSGIFF